MKFLVFGGALVLCFFGVFGADSPQPLATRNLNLISQEKRVTSNNSKSVVSNTKPPPNVQKVVCPIKIDRIPFLSLPCDYDSECSIFGRKMVCCRNRCIQGVLLEKPEEKVAMDRSSDLSIVTTTSTSTEKLLSNVDYTCPEKNVRIPIFSLPCETKSDCTIFGSKMVCCSSRCIAGIPRSNESTPSPKKEVVSEKSNDSISRTSDQPLKIDIQKVEKTGIPINNSLACPEGVRIPFFALLCTNNNDCLASGPNMICCQNRCITGVSTQKNEVNKTGTKTKRISEKENYDEKPSTPSTIVNNVTYQKVINKDNISNNWVCPDAGVRIPFFSRSCSANDECKYLGNDMVCCSNRCIKGVQPKKPEIVHSPSWFGLVERNCPVDAIVEILEIKECQTDSDCRPRICCNDKYGRDGNKSYCRTPQPSLHRFPLAERATEPLRVFANYIQCTAPPPPIFDLFPKSCNNALDCFPNLCCQEGDKKYCRPPKRSVLQLIAGLGQRFVPADAAKRLIERLN